jgi:hypothetical protein
VNVSQLHSRAILKNCWKWAHLVRSNALLADCALASVSCPIPVSRESVCACKKRSARLAFPHPSPRICTGAETSIFSAVRVCWFACRRFDRGLCERMDVLCIFDSCESLGPPDTQYLWDCETSTIYQARICGSLLFPLLEGVACRLDRARCGMIYLLGIFIAIYC